MLVKEFYEEKYSEYLNRLGVIEVEFNSEVGARRFLFSLMPSTHRACTYLSTLKLQFASKVAGV